MKQTVGQFLCRRLHEAGCGHVFGVPGDFVLGLMNNVLTSDVQLIPTCNELNAAYAADAYGRLRGIGCCMTTYNVGELSAINGIAGSFAESVPVVKITGAPARQNYESRTLLHHTLGDYTISQRMFSLITGASVVLNNVDTVVQEVDRVLRICIERSVPVYLAVCSDMVEEEIETPKTAFTLSPPKASDPDALREAVAEASKMINEAELPVILPGVDLFRLKCQNLLEALVDRSGLPFATMMLGKGVLDEEHKQFIGLYGGARSRKYVRERVESSDCRVVLGERMTDFNTGGFSAKLDPKFSISAERDNVRIRFHVYHNVYLPEFIAELTAKLVKRKPESLDLIPASLGCTHRRSIPFVPQPSEKVTMARTFDRLSHFLPENSILIAETGSSLFAACEVMLPKGGAFLGQTFYGSIGYTVGAALGACVAAPSRRVVLFVGDGSFQVTCQDLSTMLRFGCKPLVFLVNNDGYLIERVIVDRSYNDLQPWSYHQIPKVFGSKTHGLEVRTEGELEKVLEDAKTSDELMFVEIHFDKWDCNHALKEAGVQMAINNRLLNPEELARAKSSLAQ